MRWWFERARLAELARDRRLLVVAGAAVFLVAAHPSMRLAPLRLVGAMLVHDDVVHAPDTIALPTSGDPAALLASVDLAFLFPSAHVVYFDPDPPALAREFERRGASYPSFSKMIPGLLIQLGVAENRITRLVPDEGGTQGEMVSLGVWARSRGVRSVMVVTNWHHSARVQRTLRRSVQGSGMITAVHLPAGDRGSADSWWVTRDGRRLALIELQKLLVDYLTHPLN